MEEKTTSMVGKRVLITAGNFEGEYGVVDCDSKGGYTSVKLSPRDSYAIAIRDEHLQYV